MQEITFTVPSSCITDLVRHYATEAKEYHEELYPPPLQGPDMEALYMTGSLDTERRLYDLDVVSFKI